MIIPIDCTKEQYESLIKDIDSHEELPEKYRELAKRRLMKLYAEVVLKKSIDLKFNEPVVGAKRRKL